MPVFGDEAARGARVFGVVDLAVSLLGPGVSATLLGPAEALPCCVLSGSLFVSDDGTDASASGARVAGIGEAVIVLLAAGIPAAMLEVAFTLFCCTLLGCVLENEDTTIDCRFPIVIPNQGAVLYRCTKGKTLGFYVQIGRIVILVLCNHNKEHKGIVRQSRVACISIKMANHANASYGGHVRFREGEHKRVSMVTASETARKQTGPVTLII